uniref:Little elongation complex subunit 1 C-terminal domain-containing protein n=1 Tax=Pyxicephalus adspersus TaxID=30357 RepID=A0AAV3A632_PYXAD|nr:TPA: hypothetical protein GDO54_012323 [Pyxicephalus adspersus]
MSFAAKTLQLSQSEVEEKCGNSSSTLVQCEHNNELGTQDSLEFRPASTEHQFQRDSADAKTAFNLECYTAEKENNLSQPFADRYNLGFSMKKLEDESKQTMHLDLQTCAIQIDKVKESKQHAEEAGSTSKCHNKNEQGKMNPPEIFQFCSFNANPYTFVSSKAQTAVVSDVQPVTDTQLDKCSEKQTVDDQLCSARHEQSHATNLLQVKNKFPSNFDTTNADGCLGKLEQKHTSLLSKQQLLKTSEELVTVSRDHFITINKNICKGVTPKEEFCAELDSALGKTNNFFTLQSGNDTPPLKSNEMPFFSLENQQQLKLLLESSKALNKITGETNGNGDPCGPSLDSSEEDNIVIRKVSYTKVLPSNPVILKNQCKSASERLEDVCNVRLGLNDTPFNVSENIKVSSKTENSILMEHYPSVDKIVNTEDGRNHTKNTVEQYSCNREMTTLEGNNKQKEKLVSENIQYDSNNTRQNCIEYEAKKTLPGKNLIWNFERPDDSTDPRVISGKHKLQANEKMLNGNSGNSFLGSFNIEKRTKLNRPHKVKYIDFVSQAITEESRQQKLSQGVQNIPVVETVLANADTSTNLDHSPETISKVRTEMGPPLPPLLGPLLSTPPKSIQPLSPLLSSLPSPLDELISPLPGSPFPQLVSPLSDRSRQKSPVLTTPPAEKANRRILSSPLQFCAATPKHALPVPGRLPLSASSSSSTSVQENSVKILDTMYPELSARARTLNILKGNVQLNQSLPRDGKNVPVSQITGFKPITSTSTAFIKTGGNSKADSSIDKSNAFKSHQQSSIGSPSIRTSDAFLMPRSAKRLRLDTESPVLETMKNCSTAFSRSDTEMQKCKEPCRTIGELQSDVAKDNSIDKDIITKALKKIEDLCFDLLPVIRSHIFVGTIPKVPVMRNEEKEVIYEFSNSKKSLADRFLQVVLQKIKTGKRSMATAYLQAHCRVYVGLCRQLGDIERARVLCYSILKEDFPDPDRLLLFIVSSWNDIISTHGVISKAIQAVLKNLAREDVASCLSAYLNWEKTPPMNVTVLLSSVLMAVQLCPDGKFQQSKKFGEDLTDSIWEYVFAVDLLCSHRKWLWTHDNIISKELWPLLDKWVKRKKGNPNVSFVPDIVFATVIRLVGHLCQMGLKEGFITAVKNICAVITAFLQHANEEGMPWGVQLACVYMLFDLAPSDPAAIYKTLQAWKESAKNDIPPAVAICMQELESMCGFRK